MYSNIFPFAPPNFEGEARHLCRSFRMYGQVSSEPVKVKTGSSAGSGTQGRLKCRASWRCWRCKSGIFPCFLCLVESSWSVESFEFLLLKPHIIVSKREKQLMLEFECTAELCETDWRSQIVIAFVPFIPIFSLSTKIRFYSFSKNPKLPKDCSS